MIQPTTNNKPYKQVKMVHKGRKSPYEYPVVKLAAGNGHKTPS
ncbi:hypothetical protein SAMN05428949_2318 [Chitinophaga sp. YR627]|nr:hypothetical protein SAMN05428949_2318 [Chitinophaga sp. YR627]